ncbi:MAG: preprotein translocase subunit SecG [Candidatus Lloydbacteria bacterium CG22_combo_CG10-13_8_21_14_all_47_15]|uniref:Protein-export membrane protein SecG n=1 Tax=Candidatus Lloydbacteria bacterium CG22_combo_CG10-13_8_21_14_all_47_15 TaxID=1974635 RepID=A0A2H0CTW8_9BACT|nr:MAG: preprotein translocase subunit SecG [Candidatus Lloydbacteria bacterium CG22_combo_CG10-13_8_21_14_all_47_15]
MAALLPWAQIILSVALMTLILIQQSTAGAGAAFGGGDSESYHTRRGAEKTLFTVTVALAILFAATAFAALFI